MGLYCYNCVENTIILYYRIKPIDVNSRYIYSKIEKLLPTGNSGARVFIYPNPAGKEITIEFPNAPISPAFISFFNFSGKKIKQLQQINQNGKTTINVSQLKNGIYLVRLIVSDRIYLEKFVK